MSEALISVVIPAYNAEETIDETLLSVRGQSWRELEIIVVDDGSTDRTCEVVDRHAAADPRVRLLRQANAGVASARNAGWQGACSDLIAFIDADDLWSPGKLARQMAELERGGAETGLVYSRYAQIDDEGRVLHLDRNAVFGGNVLQRLMHGNFVGNGSAALVRRAAIEDAQGFEPALHRAGLQGCEDILFYLRVADKWRFGVVHEHDIGYRFRAQAMSSDLARMFRSWLMVRDEMLAKHPGFRSSIDAGARAFGQWLFEQALQRRQLGQLPRLVAALAGWRGRAVPGLAWRAVSDLLERRRRAPDPSAQVLFEIGRPA